MNDRSRIEALDSVRGLAAFVVLIHHQLMLVPDFAEFFWTQQSDATLLSQPLEWLLFCTPLKLLWAGHEAVVLFFVLSGFVLALPWLQGRAPDYHSFMLRRVCRIYLPYLAAVLISALLVAVIPHSDPETRWTNGNWNDHIVTGRTVVDNVLMLGEQTFVNKSTWSLVHEMRISLLFPLLVLPVARWGPRSAAVLVPALFILASVTPASPSWFSSPSDTLHYAGFFVLGAAMAHRLDAMRSWLARSPLAGSGLLVIGLLLLDASFYRSDDRLVFWAAELVIAIGSCFILASALSPGRIERVLTSRPCRWLGIVSYSLYLVHVPVLLAIYYLARNLAPLWVIAAVVFPAAMLAAWGFHVAIEAPATRLGRSLTARPGRPFPAVAANSRAG